MKKEIYFSPDFKIPAVDYANQGNAILGIRGAGKTYTAMKAAEGLLDAGIPILVFDPIGVWKNLQIGVEGHPGYPVVVAGGAGSDIILTPDNAIDIVRAALKDGVSLVINLHSAELSTKSTWIKIVQEVMDFLLYEHQFHGLRHIFLEEAAEFIPQRIMPNQTRVYAALERLARIGRNVGLGYTLINQRAEEVNKAILEICDLTLMHKQNGKNSLRSISQGLEYQQIDKDTVKSILASLPGLNQGQCWKIGHGTTPVMIQVSRRNTFHPDPKEGSVVTTTNVRIQNVSEFVSKLNAQLSQASDKKPTGTGKMTKHEKAVQDQLKKDLADLNVTNQDLREELEQFKKAIPVIQAFQAQAEIYFHDLNRWLRIAGPSWTASRDNSRAKELGTGGVQTNAVGAMYHDPGNTKEKVSDPAGEKLGKCAKAIFTFLATYRRRSFTKEQIGIYTGYSSSSGGFNNALSEIRGQGMITTVNGRLAWNPEYSVKMKRLDYDPDVYTHRMSKCEREIYELLLKSPRVSYSKEDIAHNTPSKYSSSSGGFNNALSRLNTLELIKRSAGSISLHPEIVDIIKNIY